MRTLLGSTRGSTTVETAVSLLFVAMTVSTGLSLSYLVFAKIWMERAAYEMVICLSTESTTTACEQALKTQTKFALPIGRLGRVSSSRSRRSASVRLSFLLNEQEIFRVVDKRKLPLRKVGQ